MDARPSKGSEAIKYHHSGIQHTNSEQDNEESITPTEISRHYKSIEVLDRNQ
ncbi:hypothetical protein CCACVL1_09810 [Corchorus capsularis]|uniref:Uncharacterized protein n=1 Tax=Corchorus capsularis TaxID=210143 RepID=A0A1R3IU33_COCAP|nr:hypothetical protein CCACVL1_09810 [Corchorus capsularis]